MALIVHLTVELKHSTVCLVKSTNPGPSWRSLMERLDAFFTERTEPMTWYPPLGRGPGRELIPPSDDEPDDDDDDLGDDEDEDEPDEDEEEEGDDDE